MGTIAKKTERHQQQINHNQLETREYIKEFKNGTRTVKTSGQFMTTSLKTFIKLTTIPIKQDISQTEANKGKVVRRETEVMQIDRTPSGHK